MKQRILPTLIAFLATLGGANVASAQAPGRYPPSYGPLYRPQLSPYLYLAPGVGGTNGAGATVDPSVRYFLGTQTEFDRRANFAQTQTEIRDIEARRATGGEFGNTGDDVDLYRPLASTGHGTAFGNTGAYFGAGYPRLNQPAGQRQPGKPAAPAGASQSQGYTRP